MRATRKAPKERLAAGAPLAPPGGMRDLLFPESAQRRALGARLLSTFASYGYDLVTTPPFELAEVIERGLTSMDRRELMRFVEPDTGEVALLRPDITPQIARVIATRLADRPPPYRLCYEGTVIRRRRGRARRQKQIAQAGVECVGIAGTSGDVEVITLAVNACRAAGLSDFRVELGHVELGLSALADVDERARPLAAEALARKDTAELTRILKGAGANAKSRARLVALASLDGGLDVIKEARKLFTGESAKRALRQLSEVAEHLKPLALGDALGVDLGEVRRSTYYTGVSFTLLADGPGEAIGAGGRYDHLLARFDRPLPATGFGLDVDHLEWALAHAKAKLFEAPVRLALLGKDARRVQAAAQRLRTSGFNTAVLDGTKADEGLAFAKAWHYDAVLLVEANRARMVRVRDQKAQEFVVSDSADIADKVQAFVRKEQG